MKILELRVDNVGDLAAYDPETEMFNWVFETIRLDIRSELLSISISPQESKMFRESETVFRGTVDECTDYVLMSRLLEV